MIALSSVFVVRLTCVCVAVTLALDPEFFLLFSPTGRKRKCKFVKYSNMALTLKNVHNRTQKIKSSQQNSFARDIPIMEEKLARCWYWSIETLGVE